MTDHTHRSLDVPVAGRSLHVREWGDPAAREAVVLIHGIPTSGLLWRDVAPRLAAGARARVLAVDLLGYGRSEAPAGLPLGIVPQSGYVLELLDALSIGAATVVGHDIGGGVAQLLATRHPGRVRRLGLVNSVCYDSWPIPEMKAIQATAPLVERMPAGLTTEGLKLGLLRGFVHRERGDDFLDAWLEPFSTPEGLDVFVDHVRQLDPAPTEEIAPLLAGLRVPVAVVWGVEDPFQKVKWGERLAAEIPTAELTRIPDASHFSPADAPEAVADALLRLLARPGVG